ncbi:MAG: SEC-C domain-containing protein [Deltaproteobacteria bacterium]|nr:SEC-C domain-containing protein [Deltaproteobacteria bacterium]
MGLLARKNRPKGHEPCPCNSGRKLRDCHRNLVYKLRQRLGWRDVRRDLDTLAQAGGNG